MAVKYEKPGIAKFFAKNVNLLLLFLPVVLLISQPGTAAELDSKMYPVFFRVDFEYYLPTSLYIKCDVKEYNKFFPDFLTSETDMHETGFKELVIAISEQNLEACLNMALQKPNMNQKDTQKHKTRVKLLMDSYRTAFFTGGMLENTKVCNQFYFGDSSVFVFGTDRDTTSNLGSVRATLIFKTNPQSNLFMWSVENPDILSSLFSQMMQQMADYQDALEPAENKRPTFQFAIPGTDTGSGHVAYLQFDGKRYDSNSYIDMKDTLDKVASLSRMKHVAVKCGYREVLGQFYTNKSKEKYLDWLKKGDQKYLDGYFKDMAASQRQICFVLDAKPLYIVFYKQKQEGGKTRLLYEYIIRDPKDDKLKFTNFYFGGFFDQLIRSREFLDSFSEFVLTVPLPKKAESKTREN